MFRNVKFSDSCLRMSNKFGTVSKASCFRRCWSETMTACSQTLCMIHQVTKGAHRTVKSLVLSAWLMKGASMWVCRKDHDNRLSSFVEVYILLHSVRVQVCVTFGLCDVLQLLWAWGSVADCWNIVQVYTHWSLRCTACSLPVPACEKVSTAIRSRTDGKSTGIVVEKKWQESPCYMLVSVHGLNLPPNVSPNIGWLSCSCCILLLNPSCHCLH
jgi:hypothetical protein